MKQGTSPNRRSGLVVWLAAGAAVGMVYGLVTGDPRYLASLLTTGLWYGLGATLADALLPWVPLGALAAALLGTALQRLITTRPHDSGSVLDLLRAATLAAGLGAIVLTGLATASTGLRPTPSGPNIVVIVMDTARADRLSVYGYQHPTSPHLEALAKDSTIFTQAYSMSSWTSPSHASLFTGLYPGTHGVTQESWSVPRDLTMLAEILRETGYRTVATVGNGMLAKGFGFYQGFETYHEPWRQKLRVENSQDHPSVRFLKRFLDEPNDRPFFAFVNFIEAHSPYNASPTRFRERVRHPEIDLDENLWADHFTGSRTLTTQELEHLSDLYDAELAFVDSMIADIVKLLRQRDVIEDTLLVVTSDHGESFGEHDMVDHVFNLYENSVRVPLLIRYPKLFEAGRNDHPVQLHDLFPTALHVAGLPSPAATQGRNLLNNDPDSATRPVLTSYYEPLQAFQGMEPALVSDPLLDKYRRRLWALRSGDRKLIAGDDGHLELYDLSTDPGETTDLSADPAMKAIVVALHERLIEIRDRYTIEDLARPEPADLDLDEATIENLKSLGYLK